MSSLHNDNLPYVCVNCDYATKSKKDYNKHVLTIKHLRINVDKGLSSNEYTCGCGKVYQHQSGLCKHRHKCKGPTNDISLQMDAKQDDISSHLLDVIKETVLSKDNIIIELLKQNQDFKDLMIEQNKQMLELANKAGHNTNCNNTTNNKFNLNVFLNETCKDAITMDDFIKSFEVTRDEFLHTGKVGYIEGLSAVMTNRFRDMDVHTRPLHCTDLKRETIYIKNADKWEKDDAAKTHMRKAVRGVARKNKQEMWRWYDENKPEVEQIGTDVCEDYFQYHRSTLGGYGKEEDLKFEDKIIHNVLSSVHVDKSSAITV